MIDTWLTNPVAILPNFLLSERLVMGLSMSLERRPFFAVRTHLFYDELFSRQQTSFRSLVKHVCGRNGALDTHATKLNQNPLVFTTSHDWNHPINDTRFRSV